ncbi:50S ribosomal protein L21, partial [termite gut metagenome]
MYAIVEINGQQFKAEAGKKLYVHHIRNVENGTTVEFDKVLLVDKDGTITVGTPIIEEAKVVCQVVTNLVKGDKVIIFHKKNRKGYRKR